MVMLRDESRLLSDCDTREFGAKRGLQEVQEVQEGKDGEHTVECDVVVILSKQSKGERTLHIEFEGMFGR